MALSMIAGAAAAVSVEGVAFASGGRGHYMMGSNRRGGAFLMMLLLLAAVVLLVVLLWRNRHPLPAPAGPSAASTSPTLHAQSILADRLARGEITPDDYRAAVAVLRETSPSS
jgi:uncharacterized membrane protein